MSTTQKVLCIPFGLAVLFMLLGCFIDFVPGAGCEWFLVVAILSVSGFFIPKRIYRVAALLLLMLALTSAYIGYRHGVEYRHWLSTAHGASTR